MSAALRIDYQRTSVEAVSHSEAYDCENETQSHVEESIGETDVEQLVQERRNDEPKRGQQQVRETAVPVIVAGEGTDREVSGGETRDAREKVHCVVERINPRKSRRVCPRRVRE